MARGGFRHYLNRQFAAGKITEAEYYQGLQRYHIWAARKGYAVAPFAQSMSAPRTGGRRWGPRDLTIAQRSRVRLPEQLPPAVAATQKSAIQNLLNRQYQKKGWVGEKTGLEARHRVAHKKPALENLRKLRDRNLDNAAAARKLHLDERTQNFLKNEGAAEIRKRVEADREAWRPSDFLDDDDPNNRFNEEKSIERHEKDVTDDAARKLRHDFLRSQGGDYRGLPDLEQLMKPIVAANQRLQRKIDRWKKLTVRESNIKLPSGDFAHVVAHEKMGDKSINRKARIGLQRQRAGQLRQQRAWNDRMARKYRLWRRGLKRNPWT